MTKKSTKTAQWMLDHPWDTPCPADRYEARQWRKARGIIVEPGARELRQRYEAAMAEKRAAHATTRGQMIQHHCVAKFDDDDDALTLTFELADERAVSLTYPKNGAPPWVFISAHCNGGEFDYCFATPEEFEDWVKIALNAMNPDRERRWLCQICKERFGFGPMLPDDIWAAIKVVPDPGYRDLMCLECMKKRARQMLGRELV